MQLRDDRSHDQLDAVLHCPDTDDVLRSKMMHVQFSCVIRTYTFPCDDETLF